MQTKVCKQCGKLKPIGSFRHYYGGRTGTYRTCLDCERINTREKYLRRKSESTDLNPQETVELDRIHTLYHVQRQAGLQPPRARTEDSSTMDAVTQMLQEYAAQESKEATDALVNGKRPVLPDAESEAIPEELRTWLTAELTREPEYYQDDVYETLREKFRPIKEINLETMLPVYDNTYKWVLDKILTRFDEYEDEYYASQS